MKPSRHRIASPTLGVVALAVVVVVGVPLVPAGATDVKPRRAIRDHQPNFNTLWGGTVNNEILVSNDAQESRQVDGRSAKRHVSAARGLTSHTATETTQP